MTNTPPPPADDDDTPPEGSHPPPPQGGYPPPQTPPPPPQGGYPPPPQGGYPPPQGGYPPPPQGFPPPQGYPPPPQGGYPPPPQGSYPPPSYGGYPPPPQGGYPPPQGSYQPPQGSYQPPSYGGYPPPPQGYPPVGGPGFGASPEVNIGEGFSWAWNKFSKNTVSLIVPTLIYGIVGIVLYLIITFLAGALAPTSTSTYESTSGSFSYSFAAGLGAASIFVTLLGYLVLLVVGGVISSAFYVGLLDLANGQEVQIGSFFRPRNVGSVLISSLLVGIAVFIGSLLCVIPGLVAGIFSIFTTILIVERNLSPIDGIKASIDIVKKNFVQVLLTYLIVAAIEFVGALLCGVGLLVAVPVASLFLVFAYRRLTGGQVAPLTP